MKAFQYDSFTFPLPEDHRFPVQKYFQLGQYVSKKELK